MTDLEAINVRQSRRGYLDTPIAADHIAKLQAAIEQYNKNSGLSIQLIEDGAEAFRGLNPAYGMFHGVRSYFGLVGKTNDENLKEKLGYYGERLILDAVKLGLGTCWVGGTFNRSNSRCEVKEDETLVCLITVGNVAEKKGFKENTIYKLAHRKTKAIEELYHADSSAPEWFLQGMKAVQKAPSAVNLQPVLFQYQKGLVTAEIKNTQYLQLIDLGIAKLHFELGAGKGKFELGNGAKGVYNY